MFWGVTLDSRKRYSQVTDDSYHLTMAALEPLKNGKESSDKYVSLNLEHKNGEYLLCTLQHGKVMQVPLNIMINKGESTCFFLNGEGTVHLTGYYLGDDDEEDEELLDTSTSQSEISAGSSGLFSQSENKKSTKTNKSVKDGNMYSESEGDESETESEADSDSANVDDDMEDESVDKTVQIIKSSPTKSANMKDIKRKVDFEKESVSKKLKGSLDTSQNSSPQKTSDSMTKKKQQMQPNCASIKVEPKLKENEDKDSDQEDEEESEENEYDNEDDEDSENDSTDDEVNSSIGRTPMPNKDKKSQVIKNDHQDLDSPNIKDLSNKSSKKSKKQVVKGEDQKGFSLSIPTSVSFNKGPTSSTPKAATMAKKNVGGVQIEDLRMGSGPPAKNGRMVSIHYTGKLTNGKIFDSNEPPKKPYSFRLGRGEVIKGFDMGILGMKVGGKRKITIPPNRAFGNEKNTGIPPNSTLVFVLELKAVN